MFKLISRILIFIIFLGGISGLFGYGIWTHKTVDLGICKVEYERILRVRRATPLTFLLNPKVMRDSLLTISLSSSYNRVVDIEKVWPEPSFISMQDSCYTMHFKSDIAAGYNAVTLITNARKMGKTPLTLRVNGQSTKIEQLIYP